MPEVRDYAQNAIQGWSNSLAGGPRVQRDMIAAQVAQEDMDWMRKERAAALAQARARAQFNAWQLRNLMGRPSAISDVAEGRAGGLRPMVDPSMIQAAQAAVDAADPGDALAVQAYLGELVQGQAAQSAYHQAVQTVNQAAQDGDIPPESAQQMLADLEDASSALDPRTVVELIRQQRTALADEEAAYGYMEATHGGMMQMIQEPPPPWLNISPYEWKVRQGQAMRAAMRYRRHWRDMKAADAEKEVQDILFGRGQGGQTADPMELNEKALEIATDWVSKGVRAAESPEQFRALFQEALGLLTGGMGGGAQGAQPRPEQVQIPNGTRDPSTLPDEDKAQLLAALNQAAQEPDPQKRARMAAEAFAAVDADRTMWSDALQAEQEQAAARSKAVKGERLTSSAFGVGQTIPHTMERRMKVAEGEALDAQGAREAVRELGFDGAFPSMAAEDWLKEKLTGSLSMKERRKIQAILSWMSSGAAPRTQEEVLPPPQPQARAQPDWPMGVR